MWIVCKQTIHMKCQDLFSKKNNKKKIYLKVSSAAAVIGTLRVKYCLICVGMVFGGLITFLFIPSHMLPAQYYGITWLSVCLSYVRPLSFLGNCLDSSNCQWIFSKLGMCIELWRSGLRLLMGKFHQLLIELSAPTHWYFHFRKINWENTSGFSPNWVCALIMWRSDLGLLMANFVNFWQSYLLATHPYFHIRTVTWVNLNGFSPNFICTTDDNERRCGLRLLIGKFCLWFTELSARDTIMAGYYRFTFLF